MEHHLFIAGTGRAGTSFLVQYLTACGLDTHLTRHPTHPLDQNANAGLEDIPGVGENLPYVVKSPWLFEYVERLLEREDIAIDAVIIPMRDIVEAASSRAIIEMRSRYDSPHFNEEYSRWETWATTPGGIVYSLNPLDQARLLALGFHQTIHALVKKQVPIHFVDFPRMVQDAAYLWDALEPILGSHVSKADSIVAHQKLADPAKARVANELVEEPPAKSEKGDAVDQGCILYPSRATLDKAALVRELSRLRDERRQLQTELSLSNERAVELESDNAAIRHQLLESQREAVVALESQREVAAVALKESQHSAEETRAFYEKEIGKLVEVVNALKTSTSWIITKPLRALALLARRAARP